MIETAFDNREELNTVVERLLEEKLVCSCQVVESDSKQNWKNKYESSREYIVFMNTRKSLITDVFKIIMEIHSYDCFDFAVFDITCCNEDYLNWIEKETKQFYCKCFL